MAEKPKFRFYTQTSFTILYLEDYQLEIQTIITGKRKQTRVFMSETDLLTISDADAAFLRMLTRTTPVKLKISQHPCTHT